MPEKSVLWKEGLIRFKKYDLVWIVDACEQKHI